MKKQRKKLGLESESIRTLTDDSLVRVAGGTMNQGEPTMRHCNYYTKFNCQNA